ncbi:MAG: hypothetical protein HQK56_02900 [Deltaproteobacteria bacterium]|nr:hypothetical protein [Deltaproteobacteria bacterium]
MEFILVGVTYNNCQAHIKELMKQKNPILELVRQPDNPSDSNAIQVSVTAGQEVCQNRRFKSIPQGGEGAPLDYRSYFLRQLFVKDFFV